MNAFNAPRSGRTSNAVICRNFLGFVTNSSRSRKMILVKLVSGRFDFYNAGRVAKWPDCASVGNFGSSHLASIQRGSRWSIVACRGVAAETPLLPAGEFPQKRCRVRLATAVQSIHSRPSGVELVYRASLSAAIWSRQDVRLRSSGSFVDGGPDESAMKGRCIRMNTDGARFGDK